MEDLQTLVLSCGFQPLGSISWKRAVTMIFSDKANSVEEYPVNIRSQNKKIKCPSVIALKMPTPFKRSMVTFSRNNIFARDKMVCQYCHNKFPKHELTLDHVVPQSRGGKTNWTNIVTACLSCNSKKSDKSLIQSGFRLLNEPVKPESINWIFKFDCEEIPANWKQYLKYLGFA